MSTSGSKSVVELFEELESPRLVKSHLMKAHLPRQLWTKRPKIILVFRNPKDVALSLFHLYKLLYNYSGPLELFLKAFVEDKVFHNPFWKHVLEFWELRNENHCLFIRYEEMKKDLPGVIRRTADFLGVKYNDEQEEKLADHLSFSKMATNKAVNLKEGIAQLISGSETKEINFIRKGETGGWRSEMSEEMSTMFDKWTETNLEGSDFPKDYLQ